MALGTVLLVDDESDIRRIGELSLGRVGGFRVLLAAGGAEGLAIARRERPDAILLDLMMPGMDGIATLHALRNDATTRDIPVVFMTAKVQKAETERLVAEGARGVIGKPFDPLGLAARLRALVEEPA